jgi:hypothetical protein
MMGKYSKEKWGIVAKQKFIKLRTCLSLHFASGEIPELGENG